MADAGEAVCPEAAAPSALRKRKKRCAGQRAGRQGGAMDARRGARAPDGATAVPRGARHAALVPLPPRQSVPCCCPVPTGGPRRALRSCHCLRVRRAAPEACGPLPCRPPRALHALLVAEGLERRCVHNARLVPAQATIPPRPKQAPVGRLFHPGALGPSAAWGFCSKAERPCRLGGAPERHGERVLCHHRLAGGRVRGHQHRVACRVWQRVAAWTGLLSAGGGRPDTAAHHAAPALGSPASSALMATCWKGSTWKGYSRAGGPERAAGGCGDPWSPGGHATSCVHDLPSISTTLEPEPTAATRSSSTRPAMLLLDAGTPPAGQATSSDAPALRVLS